MNLPDIDFDAVLERGRRSYNRKVGQWWRQQAGDRVHAYAYRKIADHVASAARGRSPVIVDYACGSGDLLVRLSRRLPDARIYGIDGSPVMLNIARGRLKQLGARAAQRVTLLQAHLPDFSLPRAFADVVVFSFPHILSDTKELRRYERQYKNDAEAAWVLASAVEGEDPRKYTVGDEPVRETSMMDRIISRNLHGILKRGGICVRANYTHWDEADPTLLEEQITGFEEGSWGRPIHGIPTERFFKEIDWFYFRSGVIRDVYHQTNDRSHLRGGYFITLLKAV